MSEYYLVYGGKIADSSRIYGRKKSAFECAARAAASEHSIDLEPFRTVASDSWEDVWANVKAKTGSTITVHAVRVDWSPTSPCNLDLDRRCVFPVVPYSYEKSDQKVEVVYTDREAAYEYAVRKFIDSGIAYDGRYADVPLNFSRWENAARALVIVTEGKRYAGIGVDRSVMYRRKDLKGVPVVETEPTTCSLELIEKLLEESAAASKISEIADTQTE